MIFDTDIFIWIQRGNVKAADLVDREYERLLSVQTYMELLQRSRDKSQHRLIIDFLMNFNFKTLPLSENIGHRAAIYIEEYALSHGIIAGDAIIAATATEHGLTLCSGNAKHFKPIKELRLKVFRPY